MSTEENKENAVQQDDEYPNTKFSFTEDTPTAGQVTNKKFFCIEDVLLSKALLNDPSS
jgi:hypothetical protein